MNKPLTVTALAVVLALTACGDATDTTDTTESIGASAEVEVEGSGGGRGGLGAPGGSGEVVQISGTTAQVQNHVGQVAVTWTDTTTFTQQVETDLADLAVGACALVSGQDDEDDESAESGGVVAAAVRISQPGDDGCGRGAGRGVSGDRGDGGFERPDTDRIPPADRPEGAPGRGTGAGPGPGTTGEVVSVSDAGFTVATPRADGGGTTTVAVIVSATTIFTINAEASASDITVGRCIVSAGAADDTGAITAESIAVSDPVDDGCAVGFGGQRRGAAA